MKILFLSTPYFLDCDFPLVRAYQEKGIDITYLITLSPYSLSSNLISIKKQLPKTSIFPALEYEEFKFLNEYLDMNKVYVANRTGRSRFSFSFWKDIWNIRNFIKQGKFDIVHYSGFNTYFYTLAPVITTFHDPFPHSGESFRNQKKIYQVAANKSKGIVLLNKTQLSKFCNTYSVNPRKVLINSLGVYDNIRTFVNNKIEDKKNNILFFGRISPYKGVEYLCKAMEFVHQQVPDATLTIAGSGNFNFDIKPYSKLGYIKILNKYITMPELADLLSACEFTVCPYTDATQSGVVMTSFSLGKPVIASAVGGLSEVIEDGKSGILVPPKNVKALADSIVYMLKNEVQRKQMSEYIHNAFFKGDRSWAAIADRYLKFYSDVINNSL